VFSDDIINRVRDSADIVDLISGYVSLRKTGKNHVGLCPFHAEKTPSFSVNPDKQIFHCFGCGVGGDVFKFLELQEGLNFPEAVKSLAGKAGITLPAETRARQDKKTEDERAALLAVTADAADYFRKELEGSAGSAARAYLAKRGVSDQLIHDFALGFARSEWDGLLRHLRQKGHAQGLMEKAGLVVKRSEGDGWYDRFRGRIIFPIRDISGNVIAFGGRVMDDSLPKYLNSPETPLYSKSNVLYLLDKARDPARKQGYFIIVEGYLDALACHQFGARNAVATLGTALTEGHMKLMRRFAQNLVLIFDPDPAGVKAALRSLDLFVASGMKVNVVSLPDGDDPDTFLNKNGYEAFASCLKRSEKYMDFVLGQVVQGGRASSIDEKVDQAGEMLRTIAKLPSGIERDYYLKKTAEALDLDEGVLRREMPRELRHRLPSPSKGQAAGTVRSRRPKAEETLIHLMLKDEGIAKGLLEQIRPEDFTDPLYRRAMERIFEVLRTKGTLESRGLMQEGDEELNRLFSHYAVLEMVDEDPARSCRDCVELLRQQDPEKQMKQIVKALKEAEEQGNTAEYKRLLEMQQQLCRRPGRRIPGL
jgi:DNA primase